MARDVLGGEFLECGRDPLTGIHRTDCCDTNSGDSGVHVVGAVMTQGFLAFSRASGNDLSSPTPWFPGPKPGDRWCLCAPRWAESREVGMAPPVVLEATHAHPFDWADMGDPRRHGHDDAESAG